MSWYLLDLLLAAAAAAVDDDDESKAVSELSLGDNSAGN
jgi:hypothetical protein